MLKYFENNFKYYKNLDVIKQFDFQGLGIQPDVDHFNTRNLKMSIKNICFYIYFLNSMVSI